MSKLIERPMLANVDDFALFAACFADNDSPRPIEALEWQYGRNPTQKILVDVAVSGTEPTASRFAGIYATLPVSIRVGGDLRLAVQSLDTLTDANFRGQGLFVRLARSTFSRAAAEGAACVFGFPNGSSAHGFFGKLEWSRLDPVPFLVRPLRTRYVANRLKLGSLAQWVPDVRLSSKRPPRARPGTTVEEIDRFDARITQLWSAFSRSIGVAVERHAAYMNWRLVDKPGESYRRLATVQNGSITAFVASTVKKKHGGTVGYVMELLHAPGRAADARHLLATTLAEFVERGADVALAWSFAHSSTFASYVRSGFAPFPERVRPIELHFGVRSFDRSTASIVEKRANWYLSYLDSDTV